MRTSREQVIKTASSIADENGLSGLSLKSVAQALGLRTPSLYNHVDSLEDLLLAVAGAGMREMNRRLTQSAVGAAGDEAVQALGQAYLQYMTEHPGVYETIQWACWHQNDDIRESFSEYCALLAKLAASCGVGAEHAQPVVRLLSGFLHGYTTQQLGEALNSPQEAGGALRDALDAVLLGIHRKYN